MADYVVEIARSAERELRSLPRHVLRRVAMRSIDWVPNPGRTARSSCKVRGIAGGFASVITASSILSMTRNALSM
jgi:hypothetical protein